MGATVGTAVSFYSEFKKYLKRRGQEPRTRLNIAADSAMKVMNKTGRVVILMSVAATAESALSGIRNTDDVFNPMFGGFAMGAFAGLKSNNIHGMMAKGAKGGIGFAVMYLIFSRYKFEQEQNSKETWDKKRFAYIKD